MGQLFVLKEEENMSYKNWDALPLVLIATFLLIFCYGGIFYIILLWIFYLSYCSKNNNNLREFNSKSEEERKAEIWKEINEKYK